MARLAAIARPTLMLTVLAAAPLLGCADLDRRIFDNNRRFARTILQPMAKHYRETVPEPLRKGLRNVTSNVTYPDTMVNNLLQGKPDRALSDFGRIAVNTVVGFGGLFDPATDIGIPRYEEDFGQTLGVWGFGPGTYFNAPFIGPTTVRDVWQYPFKVGTSPFTYVDARYVSLPLGVANYFFERFDEVQQLDIVEEAVDPYAFVKDAYLQHRESLVYDGNPPAKVDEGLEEELDEALEGLDELEGMDDLEGLDEPEGTDDLEGLDDLEGMDELEGVEEGAGAGPGDELAGMEELEAGAHVPAPATAGLPPPTVVRRGRAPSQAPRVTPAAETPPPAPGALPAPVVRPHGTTGP